MDFPNSWLILDHPSTQFVTLGRLSWPNGGRAYDLAFFRCFLSSFSINVRTKSETLS